MRTSQLFPVMDAKASTGIGNPVKCEDYQYKQFSLATDGGGTANFTIKFQGSVSEDAPTFSSAQSVTNHWDYIDAIDLQDGTSIDGDTGVSVATSDDYRLFEINNKGLKWVCARITSYSAGSITVNLRVFNNV